VRARGDPSDEDRALASIRAGQAVVIPTDTVYGLVADARQEGAARRLYELKRRPASMPCALMAADLDALFEALPELGGHAGASARALLPGPFTLVLPNPARRFAWICGATPGAVGVRVPDLPSVSRRLLERVGVVSSTSANLHGGPEPRRLGDLAEAVLAGAGASLDAGELPGTPSTVVDLTGREPVVLREGAVPAREALERARAALA